MNWITILWPMVAATCLTMAFINLRLAMSRGRRGPHLFFFTAALAVAALAVLEMMLLHAVSLGGYQAILHRVQVPLWVMVVSVAGFVKTFFGTGRNWLALAAVGLNTVVLIASFVAPAPAIREAVAICRAETFGGMEFTLATFSNGPWNVPAVISITLLLLFVADASIALWRKGERRRAAVVGGGIVLFLLTGRLYGVLVEAGVVRTPYFFSFCFLGVVMAMGHELSEEVMRAAQRKLEMEQLRSQLAHAGRVSMMGQLATALAHELNQPLGAILRNAEAAELILQSDSPDLEEVAAIVSDIRRDDLRAGGVIDRLRSLLKRRDLALHPVSPAELLSEVVSMLRSDASARRVQLELEISQALPLVRGDRVHLQQVLLNLVLNAMDALSTGERRVILRAHTGPSRTVVVSVSDTGSGIPDDKLKQVFEPFYTTKSSGMGMGLPISRTIIQMHGGNLTAENNPGGRGATFRFSLPAEEGGGA